MPSWGDILREFDDSQRRRGPQLGADSDAIRRKYIGQLRDLTGHAVIVYGSGWLKSSGESHPDFSVQGADVHALMEMCKDVEDRKLDLILHSPGGEVGAAEQIVRYLRTQFDYIRAIVPLQAKSAATMIALGCDEIVMGNHSELGPIDPQIVVRGPEGVRSVPAHAILRDFERAKQELAQDASAINAWLPVLRGYQGGLLEVCEQAITLAAELVVGWLTQYMLSHEDTQVEEARRRRTAGEIARYFAFAYDRFRTHARPIRIEDLRALSGMRVRLLEADDRLQDAVLSIYHALDLTFNRPGPVKIVENHRGAIYARLQRQVLVQAKPKDEEQAPGQPRENRQQRRAHARRQRKRR